MKNRICIRFLFGHIGIFFCLLFSPSLLWNQIPVHAPDINQRLLNEPIDMSRDFRNFSNTYYLADSLSAFNPETGKGEIVYRRYEYVTRQAFNNMLGVLQPVRPNEFPSVEYAVSPSLPFSITFVSSRTLRIRAYSRFQVKQSRESLMLVNGKAQPNRDTWQYSKTETGHRYTGPYGSVQITKSPWRVEIVDADGKTLTRTIHRTDDSETFTPLLPFSFVRRASDYSTSMAAVFPYRPTKKSLVAASHLQHLIKEARKWYCGQTMRTARKTRPCINPSRFS